MNIIQSPSPNFWKGRSQPITEIVIHHWGSPTAGYTHAGVVKTLSTPARQASAHYVVSTKVTQLVKESDTSWATGRANPWTISIEIDPRCELRATAKQRAYSDKVYKLVGELIRDIRKRHSDLPLVRHRKYMATVCPGLISLDRLNKEAGGNMAVTLKSTIAKLNKVRAERDKLQKSVDAFTKQVQSLKLALANEKNKPPKTVIKNVERVVEKIVKVKVPVVKTVKEPTTWKTVVQWLVDSLNRRTRK